MSKKLFVIGMAFALITGGTVIAAEIGLTSVLYPEGQGVDLPISGTQRAPAAQISAKVQHKSGQSSIQIQYKPIPPAVLFGGDIVSYVVWAVAPDGTTENLGGIANDDDAKGPVNFSTAKRDFALVITAEPLLTIRKPGDLVVFFSGTPAAKDVNVTAFNFAGLVTREGIVSRENESIAGMVYQKDKDNPLALIQAEKAIELMNRFNARQYDRANYDEAQAAIAQALDTKGQKRLDASRRTVILAGLALSKTAQMLEAEAEADRAAAEAARKADMQAETQALAGEASDLEGELKDTRTRLARTQADLSRTRQELQRVNAERTQLVMQQEEILDQLADALGRMATGEQTGRGYIVSLSGVAFDSGKSDLKIEAKYVLAKLSGMLLAFPEMELAIEGFTDSTGAEDFNLELSLARAQAVSGFLTEMGVPPTKMTAEGFGPARPIAPNDTPEGRARNRRVEIVLADTD